MNTYDHDCCHAGDGCCEDDLLERALRVHRENAARIEAEQNEVLHAAEVERGVRISVLVQRIIGQECRGAVLKRIDGRLTLEYARMRFGLTTDRVDLVFDGFWCARCDRWTTPRRIISDPKLGLEWIGREVALHEQLVHSHEKVSA